jgi:hypothetical protein
LITSSWIKAKQSTHHKTHHHSLPKTRFKSLMAQQIPGQLDPILQPHKPVLLKTYTLHTRKGKETPSSTIYPPPVRKC